MRYHMQLFIAIVMGELPEVFGKGGCTQLNAHGDVGDVGQEGEVDVFCVLSNDVTHYMVRLSPICQVVIKEYVESEDYRLLDPTLLNGRLALYFIHDCYITIASHLNIWGFGVLGQ